LRFRNIGFLERLDTLIRCLIVSKMLHFCSFSHPPSHSFVSQKLRSRRNRQLARLISPA
jgi:hypothetical protein